MSVGGYFFSGGGAKKQRSGPESGGTPPSTGSISYTPESKQLTSIPLYNYCIHKYSSTVFHFSIYNLYYR